MCHPARPKVRVPVRICQLARYHKAVASPTYPLTAEQHRQIVRHPAFVPNNPRQGAALPSVGGSLVGALASAKQSALPPQLLQVAIGR